MRIMTVRFESVPGSHIVVIPVIILGYNNLTEVIAFFVMASVVFRVVAGFGVDSIFPLYSLGSSYCLSRTRTTDFYYS